MDGDRGNEFYAHTAIMDTDDFLPSLDLPYTNPSIPFFLQSLYLYHTYHDCICFCLSQFSGTEEKAYFLKRSWVLVGASSQGAFLLKNLAEPHSFSWDLHSVHARKN